MFPIGLFGLESWFVTMVLLAYLLWFYLRHSPYFKTPLITIDEQGITAKDKFYSWNDIKETYVFITDDDPVKHELVLTSNYLNTYVIEMDIGGLEHSVKEISHYVEYFRQKASNF